MPATFPQTLWILKERGLAVTVKEGDQTSLTGPADMVTPDLVADLKHWKQEILGVWHAGEQLAGPGDCPEWREYLLKGWKPTYLRRGENDRRIVTPYVGITDWVQMVILNNPHKPPLECAIGWRWHGEKVWRPMPEAYHVTGF